MTLKERTAAISLAASLMLAAAKLAIGLAIGSLALITDALHSCVDFLATGVTWMAVRVADRPADAVASLRPRQVREHRGARRGGAASAPRRRRDGGGGRAASDDGAPPPSLSFIAVAVLLVEIVVNAWRARELRRVGRETQSAALEADSLHFASDVFSSFAVLAGFALIALGFGWGDAAAAIAVAALIAVLALRLLIHTINALVDRAPEGVAELDHRAHRGASPACSAWRTCGCGRSARGISSRRRSTCRARSASSRSADVEAQAAIAARTRAARRRRDDPVACRFRRATRRCASASARGAARARRGAPHHRPASGRPAGAGARPRGGRRAAARRGARASPTGWRRRSAASSAGRRRSRSTSSRSSRR